MKIFLQTVVFFILDVFLFFFKRDRSLVLCTGWSGKRFADNSRYIFLYLNANKESLKLRKIVWVADDYKIYEELKQAGYIVCMRNSLVSVCYHLRAGYFFYDQFSDDFIKFLTRKARLINLWHGMTIKKFGVWNGLIWNLKDDYLMTCSDYGDTTTGKAFYTKPGHFIHGMYPRNYYLLHSIPFLTGEEQVFIDLVSKHKKEGKKIIFYLPTFRKSKLSFLGESDNQKVLDFMDELKDLGYFMVTKMHYEGSFRNGDGVTFCKDTILNLPPTTDIYPFLKEADILITDYSSVLFDFLYLERDIICYSYDFDEYKDADKGFVLDYMQLPADKVYTLDELKANLLLKREKRDNHAEGRRAWLQKCFAAKTIEDTIKSSFRI